MAGDLSTWVYAFLALFVLQVASQATPQDQAWCSISPAHTLCLYNTTAPGPSCRGAPLNSGVDRVVANYIVAVHNIRRARVASGAETRGLRQPAAANMNQLRWSNVLARIAQRWADQCTFSTDINRNASLTGANGTVVYVGQNVYAYLDSQLSYRDSSTYPQPGYWLEAIDSWYNENLIFNPQNLASYRFEARVGHYTQLVWAETTEVGCGFTQWSFTNNRIARILVCDYGVGGNREGMPVYIQGTPCSRCAANSTCAGYLCSTQA